MSTSDESEEVPTTARAAKKKRPTQRTLEMLRAEGHTAQVVERWQKIPGFAGGGVRQDLFGCIDVVSIGNGVIHGIQCGAASGHAGHKAKCLAEPRLKLWLAAGAKFEIHSWSMKGAAGKRKLWECRREELTLADFGENPEPVITIRGVEQPPPKKESVEIALHPYQRECIDKIKAKKCVIIPGGLF